MKQGHTASRYLSVLSLVIAIFYSGQSKAADFEKFADTAGFTYDARQDIYFTKIDSTQRIFGYNRLFDFLTLPVAMVIDAEPIPFDYDGKRYMIELWKGQYHVMTGAEIGIYEQRGPTWKSVSDDEMPYMSYTLARNGVKLFDRQGTHWWLTGFVPGVFSNPEDLTLENIVIDFKEAGMRDAFLDALHEVGYDDVEDQIIVDTATSRISFRFSTTKTKQIWSPITRRFVQEINKNLVRSLNSKKAAVGRHDNSPATMDLILQR